MRAYSSSGFSKPSSSWCTPLSRCISLSQKKAARCSASSQVGLLCCFSVSKVLKKKNRLSSSETRCSVIRQEKPESQFILRAGKKPLRRFLSSPPSLCIPSSSSSIPPWPGAFFALSEVFLPPGMPAQESINLRPERSVCFTEGCFSLPAAVPGGIAPESLTFTPLDDMIFLKWEEPVEPNGLITQYEVGDLVRHAEETTIQMLFSPFNLIVLPKSSSGCEY